MCVCDVLVNVPIHTFRNMPALFSSATKTGILEIRNISQFEFGEYQCNATNVVGSSACTIELSPGMIIFLFLRIGIKMYSNKITKMASFTDAKMSVCVEVGGGVIAGAVIGALLGCVLIILVVWFIAHTVKKHKYKAVKAAEANEMK